MLRSLATCCYSCMLSIEIAFRYCSNMADNRNNTTNYPGYFLTNRNGTLLTPFHQNVYLGSFQFTTSVIGIPLNVILASGVLRSPELRSEPRNIFLLGVIFSSLSAFALSSMDVTYVFFLPIQMETEFCEAYLSLSGIPSRLMLATTFISILDRYVAIWKPLWHRAKISVVWASFGIVFTVVFTVVCNKFVYIFGIVPLRCGFHTLERQILALNSIVLFACCLTGRVAIFLQTRKVLNSNVSVDTALSVPTMNEPNVGDKRKEGHERTDSGNVNSDHPGEDQTGEPTEDEDQRRKSSHATANIDSSKSEKLILRRNTAEMRIRQMEMESIKSLVTGVTSLILLSCPSIIFISSMNVCRYFSTVQMCNQYAWLSLFVRYIYQLYGVYHPVLYLGWNNEFCNVLKTPLTRMTSRLRSSIRSSNNVTRPSPV